MNDERAPIVDLSAGTYRLPPSPDGLVDLSNETLGIVPFPLAVPFAFRGVGYSSLTLRVPNGWDMQRFLALPEGERTPHAWLSIVLEAPADVLNVMYAGDYAALIEAASRLAGRTMPEDKG